MKKLSQKGYFIELDNIYNVIYKIWKNVKKLVVCQKKSAMKSKICLIVEMG